MILGLCGSLREKSLNRMALTALRSKIPDLVIWSGMDQLPFFNPDIEFEPNAVVEDYRKHLKTAEAVIIATPHHSDQNVISRKPIVPLAFATMSWRSIMIGAKTA